MATHGRELQRGGGYVLQCRACSIRPNSATEHGKGVNPGVLNTRPSNASMVRVRPNYSHLPDLPTVAGCLAHPSACLTSYMLRYLACLSCRQIRLYLPGLGTGLGPEDEEPAEKASSSGKSTAASA